MIVKNILFNDSSYVVHRKKWYFFWGSIFVDAKKGEVYIEDGVEKPQPIKKFSLYGEEV